VTHYEVDPARSSVTFEARSSLHPITTQARNVQGRLEANGDGAPSTGELIVPIDGMSSGNILYDTELRRRLGARRNPWITATLSSAKPAEEPGVFLAQATVAFADASFDFDEAMAVVPLADGEMELTGVHDFDVRDLGIEPPRLLMLKVSPQVRVGMRIVVRKAARQPS
jgi:hypothetical protein